MNDLAKLKVKQPSAMSASTAKAIASIASILQWIAVTLDVAFVVNIPLVTFTPLGRIAIAGTPLVHIASGVAHSAVIATLLCALVVIPIDALCQKVMVNRALYETYSKISGESRANSTFRKDEEKELAYQASFQQRVSGTKYNCLALSGVIAGLAGFASHDALLDATGAPWAYLLTLVLILMSFMVLSLVSSSIANGKYRRENPAMYEVVSDMLSRRR